jgi:Type II intron maturase/Reverse transcriptase (RNA-dependent DNA polymerase)
MIPHKNIMNRLSKKIGDPRFLELIMKYLKAGSKTKTGKYISADNGTPQGGILSPILANIVLDELDQFVGNLIVNFEKGKSRKQNPVVGSLAIASLPHQRIASLHKLKNLPEEERMPLRLQFRTIPYGLPKDPNFKRMMYIRYAYDFLVLVEGSHDEAVYYRNQIKSFLLQNCGLTLNLDKTLITNMTDNKFYFLGAEIVKLKANPSFVHQIKDSLGRKSKRRGHARLLIKAPLDNLLLATKKSGFIRQNSLGEYIPQAYTQITNLSHYEIITFYNSKINGLLNFYAFASNYNRLRYILYLLQMSCAYTLARKYKLGNFAQAFSKFGKLLTDPETDIKLR